MFRKIEQSVSLTIEWIAMLLLVVMTLVVCYSVFTRYALAHTPPWSEELALLSMVWFGFLSIALGVRDNGHIGVTALDTFLPARVLYFLDYFKWLAIGAFGVFMLSEGIQMTKIGMRNNYPGLGISSSCLYVVVPIAGASIIVYCIEKIVGLIGTGIPSDAKESENA